jgi:hemerythrin
MSKRLHHLAWGPRFETGIPSIDCQHQSLFRALRYLYEAIFEGKVQAEVGVVLEFLEKYVQIHFSDEETYMKRIRFPGLLEHMVEHRKFCIRIQDLSARFDSEEQAVALETSLLLHAWFRDHILLQDMAFVEHARGQGVV